MKKGSSGNNNRVGSMKLTNTIPSLPKKGGQHPSLCEPIAPYPCLQENRQLNYLYLTEKRTLDY